MNAPPKVFISYCWTNDAHKNWVKGLANALMMNGVDVIADFWSLNTGDDMYKFMESMVTSLDIQHVLIIINKEYAQKADGRRGG